MLFRSEGATDEEATVQAVQEVQEAIRDTLPNAQTGHMNAQDYLDAVSYNATHHPARAWRVQPVPEDVLATGRPVATDHIAAVLDNQGGLHGIVIDPDATTYELDRFILQMRDEGVTNFSIYRGGNFVTGDVGGAFEFAGYREIATSSPDLADLAARGYDRADTWVDQDDFILSGPRVSHYVLDPAEIGRAHV